MSESSATIIAELQRSLEQLSLSESSSESTADPVAQLDVENAVARGVAVLAGEAQPEPTETIGRPMSAADLAITANLVLRALNEH